MRIVEPREKTISDVISEMTGVEIKGNTVILENKEIPKLIMQHDKEKKEVRFILDGRFAYIFPEELARYVADFVATAMAIGAGFGHYAAPDKLRHFAPSVSVVVKPPEAIE